jgi:hypothetical protein
MLHHLGEKDSLKLLNAVETRVHGDQNSILIEKMNKPKSFKLSGDAHAG